MNEAATAGEEVLARIAGGAMLYDASCLGQPEAAIFEGTYWQARGALTTQRGGRGTVAFVRSAGGDAWVLRHYRRGGLVAKLFDDAYFWTGESRTRAFAEWRLLRRLREWDLPVPKPIAARYQRHGLTYRADLNAHNLLLGTGEEVYVLDFDRGRIRRRGPWEQRVLARLQRSLFKVTAELPRDRFGDGQWRALLAGAED